MLSKANRTKLCNIDKKGMMISDFYNFVFWERFPKQRQFIYDPGSGAFMHRK